MFSVKEANESCNILTSCITCGIGTGIIFVNATLVLLVSLFSLNTGIMLTYVSIAIYSILFLVTVILLIYARCKNVSNYQNQENHLDRACDNWMFGYMTIRYIIGVGLIISGIGLTIFISILLSLLFAV